MRGICFRWWARWLMLTDKASFLQELCWAAAAAWRHLLYNPPHPPLDIPQGEGWRGDAAEGLRQAWRDNRCWVPPWNDSYYCILVRHLEKQEHLKLANWIKLPDKSVENQSDLQTWLERMRLLGKVCPITEIWGESGGCRWPLTTAAQSFLFHHWCKSHQAPVSAGRCFLLMVIYECLINAGRVAVTLTSADCKHAFCQMLYKVFDLYNCAYTCQYISVWALSAA